MSYMSYEAYERLCDLQEPPEPGDDPFEIPDLEEGPECDWRGQELIAAPVAAPRMPRLPGVRKPARIAARKDAEAAAEAAA